MKRRFQSIGIRRVFYIYAALLAVLMLLLWVFQVALLDRFYEAIKIRAIKQTAQAIARNIDQGDLPEQLDSLTRQPDIYVRILDREGETVYNSLPGPMSMVHDMDREEAMSFFAAAEQNGGMVLELFRRDFPDPFDGPFGEPDFGKGHRDRRMKEGKNTTLAAYKDRMPEDQPFYYYACGESVEKIAKLPQVERILDKGYEILYCTEDVDDFVMKGLGELDGKQFKSVTEEDALPQTEEEKKAAEEKAEAGKPVLEAVKEALGDQVKEVRVSAILKSAACCLSADGPVSIEMERYMRKVEGGQPMKADRVLELNADSAPFAALKKAVEAGDKDTVAKYAKLLYAQALLLAGLPLEDPAEYSQLVCSLMI